LRAGEPKRSGTAKKKAATTASMAAVFDFLSDRLAVIQSGVTPLPEPC
jgi:hypothetical protein